MPHYSAQNKDNAAEALIAVLKKSGSVAVVPTETVYGIVARAGDDAARERIIRLKKRAECKHFGIFVRDLQQLRDYGAEVSALTEFIASRFMPGALTLIVPMKSGGTVGFRMPDHPLLSMLMKAMDVPLMQTSANASGHPDPLTLADALDQLHGEVDFAVDGGRLPDDAAGSTVAEICGREVKIYREGKVPPQELTAAVNSFFDKNL